MVFLLRAVEGRADDEKAVSPRWCQAAVPARTTGKSISVSATTLSRLVKTFSAVTARISTIWPSLKPASRTALMSASVAELQKHGLKGSMGRRGNHYDNAKAESFIRCSRWMRYETFEDVAASLPRFQAIAHCLSLDCEQPGET